MNQQDRHGQERQPPLRAAGAILECPTPPIQPPGEPVIDLTLVERLLIEIQQLITSVIGVLTAGVHKGYVYPITVVIDTSRPIYEVTFDPMFKLHLQNDGPNAVQYRIPNIGNPGWAMLNPTEEIWIEFNRPLINQIGLMVAAGSASVRMVGVR
jgi:hypothetical protein